MSGDEDLDGRGSQHFSNIHVEGNSHVHIGNYYQRRRAAFADCKAV